jgi:hypothetical protein
MGDEVLDALVMSARTARRTPRRTVSLARIAVLRSSRSLERVGDGAAVVDDHLMRHWMHILDRGDVDADARDESKRRKGDRDAIVADLKIWNTRKCI